MPLLLKPLELEYSSMKKIIYLGKFMFPSLIVINYCIYLIEAISYKGFILKFTGFSPIILLIFTIIVYLFIVVDFLKSNKTELDFNMRMTLSINNILSPVVAIVYLSLLQMEYKNYPNYVFSKFHINIEGIKTIVFFSLFLAVFYFLTSYLKNKLIRTKKQLSKKMIGSALLFLTIALLVSSRMFILLTIFGKDLITIAKNPLATFEERKIEKYGGAYRIYKFLNDHTEFESTLAVPPQEKWGIVGNIGFSRYFVFPRTLVHPEDLTKENLKNIDYYVIAKSYQYSDNGDYRVWPETKIEGSQEIYLYDEISEELTVLDRKNYDPLDPIFKEKWGLIKIIK